MLRIMQHKGLGSTLDYQDTLGIPPTTQSDLENCQRMGIMATFKSFEDFELHFPDLMEFFTPLQKGKLEGEISPGNTQLSSSLVFGGASGSFSDMLHKEKKV